MTSIDSLFQGAGNATKRKFENPSEADATHAYKAAKLQAHSTEGNEAGAADDNDDDEEAGPSLPPDMEDEEVGDDEEGRFFEGRIEGRARDALDFLDAQDEGGPAAVAEEKHDAAWLRRLTLGFEKKVGKNSSLRAKYEDDPSRFMESEADLDEAVKGLSILSEHPALYPDFAESNAISLLVELLAHENTDIAIGAIGIIAELTDDDVEAEQEQWQALVAALLDADLLSLLVSNFSRFNENDAADASGVYHSLAVLENLLSQPSNIDLIGSQDGLLSWLLDRIQKEEKTTSQNKQYASEIISILTQSSRPNRTHVITANGTEILLTNLAPYRRDDPPKESEEEEYMENLFNCLTSIVDEPEGKTAFIEAEGVELCLLFVRDGKTSKNRALKVLDHACGFAEPSSTETTTAATQTNGASPTTTKGKQPLTNAPIFITPSATVCSQLVEARGLKPLFSAFMKTKHPDPESTEHILGLFASLLRSLPGNSDSRFRVLAKFLEKDYEKIKKLISLRREYARRVAAFDASLKDRKSGMSSEEQEELEMESIASRLAEGLYCLERGDAVLAWLVAEDDGAKRAIVEALGQRDEGLGDVKRTLQAQLDGVLEVEPGEREMLETLVGFLE